MPKDKNDNKTIDAFPAKKRGRPATGSAMTAADRKRQQRLRDANIFSGELDIKDVTVTALIENMSSAVSSGNSGALSMIYKELARRTKLNAKKQSLLSEPSQ